MTINHSFDIINLTKNNKGVRYMSSINNFNTIINNMKEKSIKFSKKISKGIDTKKKRDFVSEMIYGLLASGSCYLSKIARSLKEEITFY